MPEQPNLVFFQESIDFAFNDPLLLMRALTHRSYLNEVENHPVHHNERLEFLGDAIIDFIVGDYLFRHLPERHEGELTVLRAALVRTTGLAGFARQIHLGQYLWMGKGEEAGGGRTRPALLEDAFEAVVAAMYLDQGIQAATTWLRRLIEPAVEELLAEGERRNPKSFLQEVVQADGRPTPHYEVISEIGPDHARTFTIQVFSGDELLGEGEGRSKQAAAQAAARAALAALNIEYE